MGSAAHLGAPLAGLVAAGIYLLTLRRDLGWDDSAELAAGINTLGVVHQTGYPIYLLLGNALGWLLPFGSAAVTANAWSAITAAAATGLLWHYVFRLTASLLAASVAAVLLATGAVLWTNATEASVYPMFALALVLLLLAVERWTERPSAARLAALAGATGFVLMSHRTGLAFAAAVALFVVARRRRALLAGWELGAALAVLAPLAAAAYVPLRAGVESFPNALGGDAGATLDLLLGHMPAPESDVGAAGIGGALRHTVQAVGLVVTELSVAALVLAPLGAWALRRNYAFLVCGLVPALAVSAVVVCTPASFPHWHLPLIVIAAAACGAGVALLRSWAAGRSARVKIAVGSPLALLLLTGPAFGLNRVTDRGDSASAWARVALAGLPRRATVSATWTSYSALRAVQELDGVRPDVRVYFGRYFSAASLRSLRSDFVVTLSERPLRPPRGMTLCRAGPAARVNIKGLTGLRLGPLQLVDRTYGAKYVVRLYHAKRPGNSWKVTAASGMAMLAWGAPRYGLGR